MSTKEVILNRALELFLSDGIRAITLDFLARDLKMSKKTLYHFFENKKSLVLEVIQYHFNEEEQAMIEIVNQTELNAVEKMLLIAKRVLTVFSSMKPILINDIQKYYPKIWINIQAHQHQFISEIITDNITIGKKTGWFREEAQPNIIAQLYIAQSFELIRLVSLSFKKTSFSELFIQMITYHLNGIIHPKKIDYLQTKLAEIK